ncbi:Atu4866 domain-containing protein [Winogradskya humida]|nr:Atu4866 domain-containing protein [Actinoplanes humidus]
MDMIVVLGDGRAGALESQVWWPKDVLFQHGEPTATPCDSPHVGVWVDERARVVQELRPDGRYDETRNGRKHAYRGNFWIAGDSVVYHDDLDFWAYGKVVEGVLVHADFRFRRV